MSLTRVSGRRWTEDLGDLLKSKYHVSCVPTCIFISDSWVRSVFRHSWVSAPWIIRLAVNHLYKSLCRGHMLMMFTTISMCCQPLSDLEVDSESLVVSVLSSSEKRCDKSLWKDQKTRRKLQSLQAVCYWLWNRFFKVTDLNTLCYEQ